MGTKQAVCAPSSTEMYTWDNRRLQSSIGAALLIVPHEQWAFLSPSVLFSLCVFVSNDHVQAACLMIKWTNQMHICVEQKPDPCSITPLCSNKLSHAGMSTSHCRRGSSGAGTPLSVCLSTKGKKERDVAEAGDGCFPASLAHMISQDYKITWLPHDPSDMTGSLPWLHHILAVECCDAANVKMFIWEWCLVSMLAYTCVFLIQKEIKKKSSTL